MGAGTGSLRAYSQRNRRPARQVRNGESQTGVGIARLLRTFIGLINSVQRSVEHRSPRARSDRLTKTEGVIPQGLPFVVSQKNVGLGTLNRLTKPLGWVRWTELKATVDQSINMKS